MMRAIILAAGRGSRLGTRTESIPKCLVPVRGRPLLDWQLAALRSAGLTEIAIVRGYQKESIQPAHVTFFENEKWASTNMLMSLTCAADWLRRYDCLVCYSDILYDAKTVKLIQNQRADILLPNNVNWRSNWEARYQDPLSDAETFRTAPNGTLVEIGKKAKTLDEIQGQYMGMIRFSPAGWECVENFLKELSDQEKNRLDMTSLINQLISRVQIKTVRIQDPWFEVDNEKDLEVAEQLFKPSSY